MREAEWLACTDPQRMLELLRGRWSERKCRLLAVAAFRRGTFCPVSPELRAAVELAERLADGKASRDEVAAVVLGQDGSWMMETLLAEDAFSALPGVLCSAASQARQDAEALLQDCAASAWQAAWQAAWGLWQDAVKDHPVLSDPNRVWDHALEPHPGDIVDPYWYFKHHYRGDLWRYARKHFRADETRSDEWDATWEETWVTAWQAAWARGWGVTWAALRAAIWGEGDDHRWDCPGSDCDWDPAVTAIREQGWERGPWYGDDTWIDPPLKLMDSLAAEIERIEPERQVALVRDIFGNPFRSVTLSPAWLTPLVVSLAQAAYDERNLPSGELDPARLAVLADSLEEAGCANSDILSHLRGPGPHVRGCWPLELVRGKD